MNKIPPACGERPPLKDTSKNFINTPTSAKLLAAPTFPAKKLHSIQQQQQQIQHVQPPQPLSHHQKLNTSDRTPCLMETSTPKKDGNVPAVSSRNIHTLTLNSNTSQTSISVMPSKTQKSFQQPHHTTATASIVTSQVPPANNTNTNTVVKKMTGNELSKWQQTWREILPKSFIYFENDDSNERDKKRAMLALKKLGATIEPFFSQNITIIISKRPYNKSYNYSSADIFKIAIKKQLKVWNIEKVFRFISHLGERVPDLDEYDKIVSTRTNPATIPNANNNQLSNMLMNERLFGPSDRDPTVKRNDLKYFTDFYLYIYDISHRTRPVAIREWKDKSSCPRMHHTTNGKSLFVAESKSQNPISILKRHQRRIQCLNDTFAYREIVIESSYDDNQFAAIRHPNYEQRIAYKRKWEEAHYIDPYEIPAQKMKDLYLSLNDADKTQFKSLFEKRVDQEKSLEILDLSSSNKRQKYGAKSDEIVNDVEDEENDEENEENDEEDELENALEEQVDEIVDEDEDSIKEIATTTNISANTAVIDPAVDDDDNADIDNIDDDDDDDDDEEENDEDDDDDEDDDISNLVSDKVDLIDKINTRLVNEAMLIDREDVNARRTELTKQAASQFAQLRKMPKLMRQDSMINGISQTVSGDGKLLCEYGEIAASGVHASGVNPSGTCSHGNAACNIGNGLGPSKSQVVNKSLANEHKRIVVLTPTLNTRKKAPTIAPLSVVKPKVMIADDTISETPEQILGKNSSNKNTLNEDELAALRSVEAANPFMSDGCSKACKQNAFKSVKFNAKQKADNTAKQARNAAAIGIFKEQKPEKSKNELRPGYCENCRVKYSDFSEHVWSDKHRSFAEDDSNFRQIDNLIKLLANPQGLQDYIPRL